MKYLLGVDLGGGACKATLLDETGRVAATADTEYPTQYPQHGWTEQDPRDWYAAVIRNIRHMVSIVRSADILALCLDAATHTAVLCDKQGAVLRNAIHWTDTRSVAQCRQLRERAGELIKRQTYHEIDTVWTMPQLLWIKQNQPDLWNRIHRIYFTKDYIRHLLTGDYHTDHIEAQGSMLYDYTRGQWSPELCDLIDLNPAVLPPLLHPTDHAGELLAEPAAQLGLPAGTPVICGTTDTALEMLACGCVSPGDISVKLATAGRLCVVTDKPVAAKHLITYAHVKTGLWYPGTATKSCAASLRWYRDTFGGDYSEIDDSAATVPPGCDGLLFHPYLNGELTPYADPLLRASFSGIRAGHTKAHFGRAVLEGVAYSLLDCQHELLRSGLPLAKSARIIGGGGKSALWRHILADVLGLTLEQAEHCDSSLGAAMLAGVSTGVFSDCDDAVKKCCKIASVSRPNDQTNRVYREAYVLYRDTQRALADIDHRR